MGDIVSVIEFVPTWKYSLCDYLQSKIIQAIISREITKIGSKNYSKWIPLYENSPIKLWIK